MNGKPIIIAPSVFACDFSRIGEEIKRAEKAGADWFHVDIMDGHWIFISKWMAVLGQRPPPSFVKRA